MVAFHGCGPVCVSKSPKETQYKPISLLHAWYREGKGICSICVSNKANYYVRSNVVMSSFWVPWRGPANCSAQTLGTETANIYRSFQDSQQWPSLLQEVLYCDSPWSPKVCHWCSKVLNASMVGVTWSRENRNKSGYSSGNETQTQAKLQAESVQSDSWCLWHMHPRCGTCLRECSGWILTKVYESHSGSTTPK